MPKPKHEYRVIFVRDVEQFASIDVEAKDRAEAKRLALDEIEDVPNTDWEIDSIGKPYLDQIEDLDADA